MMGNPSTVAHIRKLISTEIIDKEENLTFLQKYYDEIKRFREENPRSQKILPLKISDVGDNSLAAHYIKAFKLNKMYSRWVPLKGKEFHSKFRKQISNHNTALISFVNHKKKDYTETTAPTVDNHLIIEQNGITYEYLDEAFGEVNMEIQRIKSEKSLT